MRSIARIEQRKSRRIESVNNKCMTAIFEYKYKNKRENGGAKRERARARATAAEDLRRCSSSLECRQRLRIVFVSLVYFRFHSSMLLDLLACLD